MLYEDWPSLQESEIKAYASAKVFARGRALFDEGALESLKCQAGQISALCQGSKDEEYSLSVRLGEHGIQETHCSCPYDYDGICKHLVALLLACAHTPEAFLEIEDVTDNPKESALFVELQGRESDQLAQIIVQLVETEPKLRAIVRRLLKTRLSDGEVAKTRRAVESQLRKVVRSGYETNFSQVRRELLFHLRSAASLESIRPSDAARLYGAVLEGLMASGEEPFNWDENKNLVEVSQQCVNALTRLLPNAAATLRAEGLGVLCRAYLFDINLGGYGFAEGAETVLENANTQEWRIVETQLDIFLRPRNKSQRGRRRTRYDILDDEWPDEGVFDISDWGRANVIALKARRIERFEGKEAANEFLITHGTSEQQVDAHLSNGDINKAMRLASQYFGSYAGLIRSFADKLNDAGHWPQAREWAQQNDLSEWLAHHSSLRGEPDALQLNSDLFRSTPTAQHWLQTMRIASDDTREALRAELWEMLQTQGAYPIQFDILLAEGEISEALNIWPKLNHWAQQARHGQLATAAETAEGEDAIALWSEVAESFISRKSRDAYRLAARALLRVKKLLEKEGRTSDWAGRIAEVRARYPALRALKEELERLKL